MFSVIIFRRLDKYASVKCKKTNNNHYKNMKPKIFNYDLPIRVRFEN